MGPLLKRGIPIYIKSTAEPDKPGTLIAYKTDEDRPRREITGISGKNGFIIFNLKKYLMNKQIGFGRDLLDVFAEKGVNFEHMPSGVDSISVIMQEEDLAKAAKRAHLDIDHFKAEITDEVNQRLNPDSAGFSDEQLALIAVVGEGMKHRIGMAAQITGSLAGNKVNIETLDQGSSEISMIFGVRKEDYQRAIIGLYNDLLK
jgi:aspartate kinase